MIHTKDRVSLERLRLVPVVPPDVGARPLGKAWGGVRHIDLFDLLMSSCSAMGWKPREPVAWMNTTTRREAVLTFEVSPKGWGEEDLGVWIGTINNTNKDLACRLYSGVIDCGASIFMRNIFVGMHTKGLLEQLPSKLNDALTLTNLDIQNNFLVEINKLKRRYKNKKEIDSLLMDCIRGTKISNIFRSDSMSSLVNMFENTDGSSWELLKCFSLVNQKVNPIKQIINGKKFYDLVLHS